MSLTNGFALGVLSIFACGYIIHDAPICRFLWARASGYVLYFRIIVIGLLLVACLTLLLQIWSPLLFGWRPTPEDAPLGGFFIAIVLRGFLAAITLLTGKLNPAWKHKLNQNNLDGNELAEFLNERAYKEEMIVVVLENGEIYGGWSMEVLKNEDGKWLGIAPIWRGFRNAAFAISVTTKYSDTSPTAHERMLIAVEKIVSVQPFDTEVFAAT